MSRELIEPHKGDKRYIRRAPNGPFTEKQVDVGRSLAADRRSKSKTVAKKGENDRGDQKRRKLWRAFPKELRAGRDQARWRRMNSKHGFCASSHPEFFMRDKLSGVSLRKRISIMKLIQILLPVRDNRGRKFEGELYSDVHSELVRRFGGLTAYTRSPARGLWKSEGSTKRDDMIIVEVMAKRFDRAWWKKYRQDLESKFRQDEIIVRAHEVTQV